MPMLIFQAAMLLLALVCVAALTIAHARHMPPLGWLVSAAFLALIVAGLRLGAKEIREEAGL